MKKQFMALTVSLAAVTVASAQPHPREIHERVVEHLKAVRDILVPAPAIHFVETFPPIAIPREKILGLAAAPEQERFEVPAPPPPDPNVPIDPSGVAEFANDFAVTTTQRVLDGLFPRGSGGPRRPIVVGGDRNSVPALEEDLTVMLRILDKATGVKADGPATAAGIEIFSFNRPASPRAFYLDGHGAMFVLNVKYPLIPPPKKDESSRTNEVNSEWEKAREEVYGRRGPIDDSRFNPLPGEDFDSQRVENLKSQLISDFANAKNIRHLKGDDFVTVVVLGGGARNVVTRRESYGSGRGGRPGGGRNMEVVASGVEAGAQSTMTLRVKKADIDAFAQGKLDEKEFREKVWVQVY